MALRFCFWCGTGYDRHSWADCLFECGVCEASFKPPSAMKEPQLTLEEAQAAFEKIPLTDKKAVLAKRRRLLVANKKH